MNGDGVSVDDAGPRVAIVTGAARGIGAGIVRALRAAGMAVAGGDLAPLDTWEWFDEDGAPRASRHALDVADGSSVAGMVAAAHQAHGRVDVLVNNAGVNHRAAAEDLPSEAWARVLDVNLTGAFLMSQAVFPHLVTGDDPVIVNIASTHGLTAFRDTLAYSVSKAGVVQLTRGLALEWGRRGIRVNAVGPTLVATQLTATFRADEAQVQQLLDDVPLGRIATVADVAAAVVWLCSAKAGMVNGHTLLVDGGLTAGR